MSKYKVGDKVVFDVVKIMSNGEYFVENNVPLSVYTEPLEKKNQNKQKRIEKLVERLHRQADEITRLLKENAELKENIRNMADTRSNFMNAMCDLCEHPDTVKNAESAGAEAAWELAKKISNMNAYEAEKCFPYDNYPRSTRGLMNKYSYTEAAAKVAGWERQKNEICVGDVVKCEGHYGVIVGAGEVYVKGFTSDWTPFQWYKKSCTKTGRHIDVDAWLKQIGGDENEK